MASSDASFDPTLICRALREGDENEAARVLSAGSRVSELRISKFEQDYQPLAAVLLGLFGPAMVLALLAFLRLEVLGIWWIPTTLGVFGLAFAVVMYGSARFGRKGPHEVHIDADTGRVELDGEEVASLAEFYAPRLVRDQEVTLSTAVTEERKRVSVVYAERTNADPFQLFTYPVTYQLQARMPEIADHLNALITEYNYRTEVRRWLDERTAGQAPYRRPESSP